MSKYKDDKVAAASYTFDDGYPSSAQIASIFESYGYRATFYVIARAVADADWAFWKGLRAKGHEIGNHSMTHTITMSDTTLSDETLNTEINAAQDLIEKKLGAKPLTFAFPWHEYSARALEIANQRHLSVRLMHNGESNYAFAFFDQAHSPSLAQTLIDVDQQLTDVVNSGGWFVAGGHGVDGDGWSPVTSQFLKDHLDFASQYAGRLWIDTYLNVARYRICRSQVTPKATVTSSSQAVVRLEGTYDAAVCTEPLTVRVPVKETLYGSVSAHTADGTSVPIIVKTGKLLVDVRPGEEVTIEIPR